MNGREGTDTWKMDGKECIDRNTWKKEGKGEGWGAGNESD
jgi:hypothetical protein